MLFLPQFLFAEEEQPEAAAENATRTKKESVQVHIEGKLSEAQSTNIRNYLSFSKLDPELPLSEGMFAYYLEKAKKEAATALEPFGYYNAKIDISGERSARGWSVRVKAELGEAVRIDSLDLSYSGEGADEKNLLQARDKFGLSKGEVFNHSIYEQNKSSLLDLATELGYPRSRYETSRVEVRRSDNSADVFLHLDTGIKYTVADLDFNSTILDHELLQRISPVKKGDALSPHALTAMRQSLYDSNYFSTVDVNYDLAAAEDGKVPVEVLTTPAPRNRYGFGLGYGTDTGARATLDYSNRYVNRKGHQLDMRLRPSERLSSFAGMYGIPIGDPSKDRLTINTAYQTESFANIDTTSWLSKVSREHNWKNGQVAVYLQYLDEKYDTGLRSGHASLLIPGISGSLVFADNRINTRRGLRLWASLEGSEDSLLASTSFIQAKAGGKGIYTFFDDWRIISRGQIGTTWSDDLGDLPPSLRFYAGGDQSVRGYGYKKIAPRDKEDNIIGGRHLMVYSVELERILFGSYALAAFYDSAAVMNDFADYTMISGAGVGFHWNAPFGQLRLDLAVPVEDVQLKTIRIHFTIGTDL
ncbi:MAG: autotransporter assembly complex family protein [bacterium]|nr:autotransporter assembly complex family protein [bacterium]